MPDRVDQEIDELLAAFGRDTDTAPAAVVRRAQARFEQRLVLRGAVVGASKAAAVLLPLAFVAATAVGGPVHSETEASRMRPSALAMLPVDPAPAPPRIQSPDLPTPIAEHQSPPVIPSEPPSASPIRTPGTPSPRARRRPAATARTPPPAPAPSTLAMELALLNAAERALERGDLTTARASVAQHARVYPAGLLTRERNRLRQRIEKQTNPPPR